MAKPLNPSPQALWIELERKIGPYPRSMQRLKMLWDNGLEQMVTLYYPPFTATDDGEMLHSAVIGLQAYLDDLGHVTPEQFQYAYRMVRRSHRALRWPLPEAFLKHLPPPPDITPPKGANGTTSASGAPMLRDTTVEEQIAMGDASWPVMRHVIVGSTEGKFSEWELRRLVDKHRERLAKIRQERQYFSGQIDDITRSASEHLSIA